MDNVDFKERSVQLVVAGFVICAFAPIVRVVGDSKNADTAAAIVLGAGMLTVVIGVAMMMIRRKI